MQPAKTECKLPDAKHFLVGLAAIDPRYSSTTIEVILMCNQHDDTSFRSAGF
jgi:hypothetical protein